MLKSMKGQTLQKSQFELMNGIFLCLECEQYCCFCVGISYFERDDDTLKKHHEIKSKFLVDNWTT